MNTPVDETLPLLFGASGEDGIVAVELEEGASSDEMVVFVREGRETRSRREPFTPFVVAAPGVLDGCPVPLQTRVLDGAGALSVLGTFPTWKALGKARTWLSGRTGRGASASDAPYFCLSDPVQQFLMLTGRTLFRGMEFGDLKRLQVDIECRTSEGYEFCNASREGDRIIAIGLADSTGWEVALSGAAMDEKALLERFVALVRERDPDVLEGHNVFNFDLPYLATRARRHRVKLALGRDGTAPAVRASRWSAGERTIAYDRFEIFGRHVVDTFFLLQSYDVSHRSLDGFGLKEAAVHFGLAAADRTYIEGARIGEQFDQDPAEVMRYVLDDVRETRGLATLLSPSSFMQARMLPFSYQNVCVRGTATKIDALMVREYLRQGRALPVPDAPREFEGGYTDMFVQGVVRNVHHCDIRSLYPSLMLARRLGPGRDELGVFLALLERLRDVRLRAKAAMRGAESEARRNHFDALQTTFKLLINSFYGYLGFAQARFNDFGVAERVTGDGRALLRSMIDGLRARGATPVEIDTDGIYFVPPPFEGGPARAQAALAAFRTAFAAALPEGIEIEFDGEYSAMFSYRMKNYALLDAAGEMVIKGAALKSRGLEEFQRAFLREVIRLKLEGRDADIPALKARYETAIRERQWPIARLAKTENLLDSPAVYQQARLREGGRARSAVYELALKSGREYRAGDQISYYVTGNRKSVQVHEAARLVSDWNPSERDENVPYYLAKLDALYAKFAEPQAEQGDLGLGV